CQYTGASRRSRRKTSCGKPLAYVSGSARFTPRSKVAIAGVAIVTVPNKRLVGVYSIPGPSESTVAIVWRTASDGPRGPSRASRMAGGDRRRAAWRAARLRVERPFDYGSAMRIVDADGHVAEGAALTVQCMERWPEKVTFRSDGRPS